MSGLDNMEKAMASSPYRVQVYVAHGFYEYEVGSAEQALAHGQAITNSGVYRRSVGNAVEFHRPYKVKVVGPGLESKYLDRFVRT